MKEEKYYTPSIEEFHVGFEYEVFDNLHKAWNKENNFFLQQGDFKDPIRVKFLDREDIESLGWKYNMPWSGNHLFNYIVNKKGDIPYRLYINYETHTLIIRHPLSDGHEKFSGIIKNKSELKFIMKSLQITK